MSGPPPTLPEGLSGEARIPAPAVRLAVVALGALLSFVVHGADAWLVVGTVLAAAAALAPQSLIGWLLMLVLAAGWLAHRPGLDWRLLVLIAGLHLLQVLGTLTLALPWRSRVAPAVLLAPLRRWAAIELVALPIAVICLLALAPGHGGHRPLQSAALGVVGALALVGVGGLVFARRG